MLKEYKDFVIRSLYFTNTASGTLFRDWVGRRFFDKFQIQPDKIEVLQEDKYTKSDDPKDVHWIGKLTLILTINGESYSLTRDWEEEYNYDTNHPCYNDDYYYESEVCHSYKTAKELLKNL